ncbi:3-keto-disaccharide hydrolase [Paludibaculum fermentans]|uniref:3-keto-disaccharide hydrolase n=1 Tax=Paludibaculum fermentans TaxID=1473598 RepID=UPI003EB99C2F
MILSRPKPLHFILLAALTATACFSQEAAHKNRDLGYDDTPLIPGQKWRVHDNTRKHPPKVTAAAQPGGAPSDAIVLFDGKDLSHWVAKLRGGKEGPPEWKVENGYVEVAPGKGGIATKEKFGDAQYHIEWQELADVSGTSQSRGNSGVEIMGRYEIQVLDSYQDLTYADGQAASIYGQWPPMVNATRKAGEWNVYDIVFEAPKFDGDKVVKPAYITLFHNGVLMHNRQEVIGRAIHARVATYAPHAPEEALSLQNHGNAVRFRNIWVRRLKGYDPQ